VHELESDKHTHIVDETEIVPSGTAAVFWITGPSSTKLLIEAIVWESVCLGRGRADLFED